jgi:nucleoside-diphosphate-sugar epimerase
MANVIDRHERTNRKRYNVQNSQSVTFDGIAEIAAKVMGKSAEIVHYEPKDFKFPSGKKAFPMRPQHFFTGIRQAMTDLDWSPEFDSTEAILKDAYENDFLTLKAEGKLTTDFTCDDIILQAVKVPA